VTPRLIASDIDGTLLRSDGTVSDRTRRAVAEAEESGLTFLLVTGRPPRWMAPIVEALGHRAIAICSNGAVLYDLHTEQIVQQHPLVPEQTREVVTALRRAIPDVTFAVERGVAFGHEPGYRPLGFNPPPQVQVAAAEELLETPAVKLLARSDMDAEELVALATEVVGELATVTYSGLSGLLEISAAGISKAFALEQVAAEHGVTAPAVVAFGDMPNDIPMLAWAGRSVAVANAHPQVIDVADEVTATNDDDGVAVVIERLLAG
jgi:Cof subfamily protein (haloacid dehalogenase superfamily)